MTQEIPQTVDEELETPDVKVTRIGDREYVAKEELDRHMLRIVGKLTQLATRQHDQLVRLNTSVDLLYDMLAEHYPDLRERLLDAMQTRNAPV